MITFHKYSKEIRVWEDMKKHIVVVGGGVMGRGIVLVLIKGGYRTTLVEVSEDVRREVGIYLTKRLDRDIQKDRISMVDKDEILARYRSVSSIEEIENEPAVVIEAVPEVLELKQRILRRCNELFPQSIFASNTSSLPISRIAEVAIFKDKVIGMHWFNPPPVRPLIEIVIGEQTAEGVLAEIDMLARDLGKEVIVVKDFPGFATSRLGVVIGLEAIRMLEQGVASAEDIDKAMVLGYGFPMGPLELTDLVGLDTRLHIAEVIRGSGVSPSFEIPELLYTMVKEGNLGKKTGQGFYTWLDGKKV